MALPPVALAPSVPAPREGPGLLPWHLVLIESPSQAQGRLGRQRPSRPPPGPSGALRPGQRRRECPLPNWAAGGRRGPLLVWTLVAASPSRGRHGLPARPALRATRSPRSFSQRKGRPGGLGPCPRPRGCQEGRQGAACSLLAAEPFPQERGPPWSPWRPGCQAPGTAPGSGVHVSTGGQSPPSPRRPEECVAHRHGGPAPRVPEPRLPGAAPFGRPGPGEVLREPSSWGRCPFLLRGPGRPPPSTCPPTTPSGLAGGACPSLLRLG